MAGDASGARTPGWLTSAGMISAAALGFSFYVFSQAKQVDGEGAGFGVAASFLCLLLPAYLLNLVVFWKSCRFPDRHLSFGFYASALGVCVVPVLFLFPEALSFLQGLWIKYGPTVRDPKFPLENQFQEISPPTRR